MFSFSKLFLINFVNNYTNSLLLFVLFNFTLFLSGRLARTGPFLYHWGCSRSCLCCHSVVEDLLLEQIQIEGWNGIQLTVHVKGIGTLRLFGFWLDKPDLLLLLKLTGATAVRLGGRCGPVMFNKIFGNFLRRKLFRNNCWIKIDFLMSQNHRYLI